MYFFVTVYLSVHMDKLEERVQAHQRKLAQVVQAHNNLSALTRELVSEANEIHNMLHELSQRKNVLAWQAGTEPLSGFGPFDSRDGLPLNEQQMAGHFESELARIPSSTSRDVFERIMNKAFTLEFAPGRGLVNGISGSGSEWIIKDRNSGRNLGRFVIHSGNTNKVGYTAHQAESALTMDQRPHMEERTPNGQTLWRFMEAIRALRKTSLA
jgi:hypothetical protein